MEMEMEMEMEMKIQTYLKKLKGCVAEGNPHHTLFT
jgi:hypothetical protein